MSEHPYRNEQQTAVQAIREAASLCRSVQSQHGQEMMEKTDRSPVTIADFGSQALICQALRQAFPADPLIAEEGSELLRQPKNASLLEQVVRHVQKRHPHATASTVCEWIDYGNTRDYNERFWTLDPIDGTKGFLRREQYALALALIVRGQIQVAVLACPQLPLQPGVPAANGVIFVAVRGQGSGILPLDCDQATAEAPVRVQVSQETDPSQARFCESVVSGHSSHGDAAAIAAHLGITTPPVRLDSQAKYAVVARGEAEIYLRLPTGSDYRENIWDHAAGVLIISEAGGAVTDITGQPLDFTQGPKLLRNRGVIVTNGWLHPQVLQAVRASGLVAANQLPVQGLGTGDGN
jgi:3'(2'), 5'-bisphosphate nucleotidase